MKIFETKTAPNPRRVRMFMAEKGLLDTAEFIQIDLQKGENLTPEYAARNPMKKVPVMELDDGTCIRHGEEVGMGGRHVEPGGESGKTRAVLLHVGDRLRRHELRPLAAEEIGIADHEIFDALVLGVGRKIQCHVVPLWIIWTLMRIAKDAGPLPRTGVRKFS